MIFLSGKVACVECATNTIALLTGYHRVHVEEYQ